MRGATLKQLRAFSVVARHRCFARAAAELYVTPSAVSLQIKELEAVVGLPLFGRSGKGAYLTPAGELLLVDVNRALDALKKAGDTLTRLNGRNTGIVSVGMVTNAKYFMPRLLANFHASNPDVEMRVTVGNRETLLRQVGNRELDFAVMGEPPLDLGATSEPLGPQPLGILAAPTHRFARESQIPAAALADCGFIVREPGSGTRAAMEGFFYDFKITPPRIMEFSSNESIKQAVIGNMGLTFLSLHTAGLELRAKMLVMLDVVGLPLMRSWHVVSVRSKPKSEAAESLQRFIVESGGRLIEREFGLQGHGAHAPRQGQGRPA